MYWKGKGTGKARHELKEKIPAVQILDPAVGTATFLNESIKYIYYQKFENQKGLWNSYVNDNILRRFNGFELMMTPYTIAHLKLGMTLNELGAKNLKSRLRVFLTNTLTEGIENDLPLFTLLGLTKVVAEESSLAAEVKNDLPVMVVMGNPPYSGESSNKTKFANSLIDKYKYEPGGKIKLKERNPKWLNDDYVKFISYAEDMIEKNGKGIMAMITNNGYLDNPTFRGMRWHLMKTFDKIYVLNLHGNAKKKETSPDGSPDQNVFDIMQGVGIIVAVKTSNSEKLAKVYHSEIYGLRNLKFGSLNDDVPKYRLVMNDLHMCYFVPKKIEGKAEYENGVMLNELMPINSVGVVTGNDNALIDEDEDALMNKLSEFKANGGKGKLNDRIRGEELNKDFIEDISYRPFDCRKIYYDPKLIERARKKVMLNLINKVEQNCGVVVSRTYPYDNWASAFVVDSMSEFGMGGSYPGNGFIVAPLYIFHSDGTKSPNFDLSELKILTSKIGEQTPEDILDYIYAILHSPSYREKYKEFLKIDFPRVPTPTKKEFARLVPLGRELRELHLMHKVPELKVTFPIEDDNVVEKVSYGNGKVYINKTQYFDNVSELAWNFFIGGYQPAQKWLKDRKGRTLNYDDIVHYEKIIAILEETDRIMKKIA